MQSWAGLAVCTNYLLYSLCQRQQYSRLFYCKADINISFTVRSMHHLVYFYILPPLMAIYYLHQIGNRHWILRRLIGMSMPSQENCDINVPKRLGRRRADDNLRRKNRARTAQYQEVFCECKHKCIPNPRSLGLGMYVSKQTTSFNNHLKKTKLLAALESGRRRRGTRVARF